MMPVSDVSTGAVQPLTTAGKVLGASKVRDSGEEDQSRRLKPVMDEYVPEEPREPSGRYWVDKDQDGQPKIYFDDPERAADRPKQPEGAPETEEPEEDNGVKCPERKGREKEERCVGNTDKVDREIEKLKKKRQELEQRLSTESDEGRAKELERQLAQVEKELKQKDNDTYRRQHSTFTQAT